MKIILWDHRRSGKHKHMGELETTVNGLLNARELDASGELVTFTVKKYEKAVGTCEVMKASIIGGQQGTIKSNGKKSEEQSTQPSHDTAPSHIIAPEKPEFIDYLTGGCQISLAVAIDFTASNGDPRQEGIIFILQLPKSGMITKKLFLRSDRS
jgi:hypothetical protein